MPSAAEVRTDGRFTQWEVLFALCDNNIASNTFTLFSSSSPWQLLVNRDHYGQTYVILMTGQVLQLSDMEGRQVATVRLKFIHFCHNQQIVLSPPSVKIKVRRSSRWPIDGFDFGRVLLIELKLIDIAIRKSGAPPISLWPSYQMKPMSQAEAQSGLGRMLKEGILCDITINTIGGSTRAHRAVLAVRSPVFTSIFSHDLKEKEQSTVDIADMSIDACRAFISYFYGNLSEECRAHRSELLTAADKYGVADLKNACEKSMLDDVDTENVLAKLQMAHLHGLPELRRTCARMLVEFRKMYEIPEDFREFLATGDTELVAEVLQMRQAADDKFVAYHQDVSSKWFGTPTAR